VKRIISSSVAQLLAPDRRGRVRQLAVVAAATLAAVWLVDASVDNALGEAGFVRGLLHPPVGEVWTRALVAALIVLLFRVTLDRARLRLLSAALAEAPDGVQIADLEGRIAYSNAAAQRIFGYAPEELRGRHVDVMNDDPHFAARVVFPTLRQEGRWAGEIDVRHKDGRVFPIWLTTALIEGVRGRPMAAVGVIRDISERKRSEEEQRSYAGRLEEANRLKELFADILRHDLLGPVSTVRLSLEMLLQRAGDPLSKRLLERASRNCSKLTEMIESAAKYAKVSTLQEIEFGRIDLGAVLAEVIAQSETLAEAREARIELAGGGAYPARAHPMIADVFSNLVSNALKYGPARGQVTVEVQDAGDRWRVSVADRGDGIPDGDKGRVFTRFERLAKEGVQGTGLGLAIAKRIVEMHHGAIEIADNPGGGAVFRVTLPKA
jgi:PAS domain S-box-containing protein